MNGVSWAPHSAYHVCTVGDDKQALIWDIQQMPRAIGKPNLFSFDYNNRRRPHPRLLGWRRDQLSPVGRTLQRLDSNNLQLLKSWLNEWISRNSTSLNISFIRFNALSQFEQKLLFRFQFD